MTAETITHLLLAPVGTTAQDIAALCAMQYPELTQETTGALRLEPHIVGFGPLHHVIENWNGTGTDFDQPLDVRQFTPSLSSVLKLLSVEVAKRFPVLFSITTLKERGDKAPYGIHHPDGLFNAFPTGLPEGAEERAIDLVVAIARHLGGAVCFADVGSIIIPDPVNKIDRVVYSPYWIAPLELGTAIKKIAPSARLATDPSEWTGPSVQIHSERPLDPGGQLSDQEFQEVHAQAEQVDLETLAAPDELDAYAYVIPVGSKGSGGVVEVRATGGLEPVPVLAGRDWQHSAVGYSLMWGPADEEQLMHQHPHRDHVAARAEADRLIKLLSVEIGKLTQGVVVSDDGFVVPH